MRPSPGRGNQTKRCRRAYDKSGSGWTITKFGNDRLLRTFLSYVRENHAESVSDDRVLAAGLRDWGLKPFVGACHAWRSGTDPTLVINYLKAFSMLPSVRQGELPASCLRRGVFGLPGLHRGRAAFGGRSPYGSTVWHQQG